MTDVLTSTAINSDLINCLTTLHKEQPRTSPGYIAYMKSSTATTSDGMAEWVGHSHYILCLKDPDKGFSGLSEEIKIKKNAT